MKSILLALKQNGAEGKACRDWFISSFLSSEKRAHHPQPSRSTTDPIDFFTPCPRVIADEPSEVPNYSSQSPHHTITRIPTVKGWSGDPEIVKKHLVDASRPNSILAGQLRGSMRAQALQWVLDLLRLLWLVRWPLRHLHHVLKN